MSFTEDELRILRRADDLVERGATAGAETPAQRRARHSRESRERRRERMGDEAYRAMCRERRRRWEERRRKEGLL